MSRILLCIALAAVLVAPERALAQSVATVRAFSTVASEGFTAPNASSFVKLGNGSPSRYVEVSFAPGGSVANTPDDVSICVWYRVGTTVRLGSKHRILAADISAPASLLVESNSPYVYATACSFTGGSSPTVTLTVTARQVQ